MTSPAQADPAAATVLALHHGYRVAGGEERSAAQLAHLAETQLGERVAWLRRDSTKLSAGDAARGLLAGGTGASQVTDALKDTGADLLHAHNLFPTFGPAALKAARDAGAGVVVHLHNYRLVCAVATTVRNGHDCTECHRGKSGPGLRHRCRGSFAESSAYAAALPRWQKSVIELADVIVVPSVAARTRLLDLGLSLPLDRVHVVGGVAPSVARQSTASQGRFALSVTRLAPEKDLMTAIDACRLAGVPLVIAGDGPERARLEAHAGPRVGGSSRAAAPAEAVETTAGAAPGVPAPGATDAEPLAEPPVLSKAAPDAPAVPKPRSLYRGATRRSDTTTERVRKPAIPPPPRDFPAHHNPFLSQVNNPPSKAPPREHPAEVPATPTPEPQLEATPTPEPQLAPAPATRGHYAVEALLGTDVLALLDGEPTVHGNTVFVGRASEEALAALRGRARIGLATSVAHETFGLSALESMVAGLPTVGSAVGALPELIGDDLTVVPGDANALAELIKRVAGDDHAGLQAAHRASRLASPALVAERLAAAYAAAREQNAGRSAYR